MTDDTTHIEVGTTESGTVFIAPADLDRLITEMEEYCKTGRDKLLRLELACGGDYYIPARFITDFGLMTPDAREATWARQAAITKAKKSLYPESD